jgi:hypothetical protein
MSLKWSKTPIWTRSCRFWTRASSNRRPPADYCQRCGKEFASSATRKSHETRTKGQCVENPSRVERQRKLEKLWKEIEKRDEGSGKARERKEAEETQRKKVPAPRRNSSSLAGRRRQVSDKKESESEEEEEAEPSDEEVELVVEKSGTGRRDDGQRKVDKETGMYAELKTMMELFEKKLEKKMEETLRGVEKLAVEEKTETPPSAKVGEKRKDDKGANSNATASRSDSRKNSTANNTSSASTTDTTHHPLFVRLKTAAEEEGFRLTFKEYAGTNVRDEKELLTLARLCEAVDAGSLRQVQKLLAARVLYLRYKNDNDSRYLYYQRLAEGKKEEDLDDSIDKVAAQYAKTTVTQKETSEKYFKAVKAEKERKKQVWKPKRRTEDDEEEGEGEKEALAKNAKDPAGKKPGVNRK